MKTVHREELRRRIETRMEEDMSSGRVSGVALSVFQNGESVYRACFGTTVPGGGVPVTDKTVYRMASMTKPVTVAAALCLADEGKFSLDDPIERYLPACRDLRLTVLDTYGNLTDGGAVQTKPTIRHLLTHSSGFCCAPISEKVVASMPPSARRTIDASVDFFARAGLAFEPGSTQAYSGIAGFEMLGKIMEMVEGESLETILQRRVLTPCEMEDTTFEPSEEQWARMIAMHDYKMGVATTSPTVGGCVFENYPATHHLAGGGLISTLSDYEHFAEMLLAGGVYRGKQILSPERLHEMSTPQLSEAVQPGYKRWGLGVRVIVGTGYRVLPIGAFGWSGAYGTHFWVDPVNRVTAIYLKNSRFDNGSGARTSYHFEEDVHHSLV